MTQPFKLSKARFLAYPAAALAISTSAAQSVLNGVSLGAATSSAHAAIFAAGSLAGAVLQPISWLCAFIAWRQRQFGRVIVAVALGSACLIYATLSSLGFVSTSRTDASAARGKNADTYALAKAQAEAAVSELKAMAAAPHSTKKVEAERAARRVALETTVADTQRTLRAGQATGQADPSAETLAVYAAAVGLNWTAEQIAPWITAATVLFFEVASGASMIVVSVLAGAPVEPKAIDAPTPAGDFPVETEEAETVEKRRGRRRSVLPDDVIDRVRAQGGRLNGSLNMIAEKIGAPSKSTAHRVLQELSSEGRIRYDAGAGGSSVALS